MNTVLDLSSEFSLVIDYTKTIEQAIADGNYAWKDDGITSENFPISSEMTGKKVEVKTKLFNFGRNISSEDAIDEMSRDGYRPATTMELLVLGFLFPELQRQFKIAALGSVWHRASDHYVPFLGINGARRLLYRGPFGGWWDARDRFLGVRK